MVVDSGFAAIGVGSTFVSVTGAGVITAFGITTAVALFTCCPGTMTGAGVCARLLLLLQPTKIRLEMQPIRVYAVNEFFMAMVLYFR